VVVTSLALPTSAKALDLLGALLTAAEHEAEISGREPAPAYTERAAIIHRKRRDYAAEIAVIELWEGACPPESGPRRHSSEVDQKARTCMGAEQS
jgi:hypothetical protein